MIEGRDIGTVVAPDAEVKVYLVADPAVRARRAPGRAARHRRRRARDRPQAARRVRPRPHAAGRRRGARSTRPSSAIEEVIARIEGLVRAPIAPSDRGLRRLRLADVAAAGSRRSRRFLTAAAATGSSASRDAAAACSRSTTSRGSTSRSSARCRRGTSTTSRRSSCSGVPGFGRFVALARDHRRPARRVRPRRGAADAPQAARDGRAIGLFVEGTRQRTACPGTAQPGAAMVALQEDVPVVPIAVYGTQFWKPVQLRAVLDRGRRAVPLRGARRRAAAATRRRRAEIERRIRVLFDWLADVHARGRPPGETPPL